MRTFNRNRKMTARSIISNNFKLIQPNEIKLGLDEIIGHQECKKDLKNILQFLNNPEVYKNYEVIPYSKYLLTGLSGVGKSALACAVAKEANVPIFVVEPSFYFNTEEIGEQLDNFFSEVCSHLKNNGNCMLLFKEIQYISALDPTVSPLLIEKMVSYFRHLPELVAFGTVSLSDECEISNLLIEPPAFSKMIELLPPELKVREELIRTLLKDMPVEDELNINRLSLDTYQMTTGDIKKLIKDAKLMALRNNQEKLSYHNFAEALAQSDFGYKREKLSKEERLATARHEAGHVIAGYFSAPGTYKISKVEITPRSFYLGITQETADEEKKSFFRKDLEAQIIGILGGMASEEYYYKATSAGVSSDLEQATAQAIMIFKAHGMSKRIGPICLVLKGYSLPIINNKADILIQKFLKEMYEKATFIIQQNTTALEELTNALIENEVVYSEEVMAILKKYSD